MQTLSEHKYVQRLKSYTLNSIYINIKMTQVLPTVTHFLLVRVKAVLHQQQCGKR